MTQKMHRTQIYLTDAQYHYLHELSLTKHLSMAEVIRGLIDKCLPQAKDYRANDLFVLGKDKFKMGRGSTSLTHDQHIYRHDKKSK